MKEACQHGTEYTNRAGKSIEAKAPKLDDICGPSCGVRCKMAFPDAQRLAIFNSFWKMGWQKHPQYYSKTILATPTDQKRTLFKHKRSKSVQYSMQNGEGELVKVCKPFYLNTHKISQSRIKGHLKHIEEVGNPVNTDHPSPATKLPERKVHLVRCHIESFPYLEPHYVRKETNRIFYPRGLTISRMYSMYKTKLISENQRDEIVKEWKYREIFNTQYNISFKPPDKDLCDKCELYKLKVKAGTVTTEDTAADKAHIKSKNSTRAQRQADHENEDQKTLVVSFDLENVFALPRIAVSSAFYKRNLNTYNLTARNKKSYCAVWHETIGVR